ncbi:hypothetical protein [Tabrizicola sp.]|uniref:hypothetical protein n=1 Tax=Tabrizicola sp. TaxID=2005166 RepID=UPI00286C0159|nr:hypothetical protein [Tabrizicola sp.]
MNFWLLTSGIAMLLLSLVHIFLGGREIHLPMVKANWPDPAKAIWSVVWHITTAMMIFGGLALVAAAARPDLALALAALPLVLSASAAILFVVYSLTRLRTLRILPHWIAFSAITLVGTIGLL